MGEVYQVSWERISSFVERKFITRLWGRNIKLCREEVNNKAVGKEYQLTYDIKAVVNKGRGTE